MLGCWGLRRSRCPLNGSRATFIAKVGGSFWGSGFGVRGSGFGVGVRGFGVRGSGFKPALVLTTPSTSSHSPHSPLSSHSPHSQTLPPILPKLPPLLLAGVALGLSFPPFGLYPLAWVALVPLVLRLREATSVRAMLGGGVRGVSGDLRRGVLVAARARAAADGLPLAHSAPALAIGDGAPVRARRAGPAPPRHGGGPRLPRCRVRGRWRGC